MLTDKGAVIASHPEVKVLTPVLRNLWLVFSASVTDVLWSNMSQFFRPKGWLIRLEPFY